jgi:ADP-ribose pyrophosphatase
MSLPPHPDLRVESDDQVWTGRFPLQVVRFRNRRFDGTWSNTRTWELWRRGRAAAVLPYDPVQDAVVLTEQFRLPALAAGADPVMVEVPAGLCDGEDDAAHTARREAEEEANLMVMALERIGDFVLTAGGSDERCALFAGRVEAPAAGPDGLIGTAGLASENEDIRVRRLPAPDAVARALAGDYPNAVTSLALLWLASRRDWLRERWGGGVT